MFKSKRNFAYAGKTYFVGDPIPKEIASQVDPSFVETPEPAKTKHTPTKLSEGE
jgi:hypothetical protein